MFTRSLVLLTVLIVAIGGSVLAAPGLIDYQGYIEDSGSPITDTVSMTFTIYDAATDGNSKWTETQSTVAIIEGIFNVTLGSSTAINDSVFYGDSRYLEISVAGSTLSPRTRIASSAYSLRVETVDGAMGGTIWGHTVAANLTVGSSNVNTGSGGFVAGHNQYLDANWACIGGGLSDSVFSGADYGAIAGGQYNKVYGQWGTVGGGYLNYVSNGGDYGTVSGGNYNGINGDYACIAGGYSNLATGNYATVSGGDDNEASGDHSFAAGRRAKATHDGSFVWADSYSGDFSSTATNRFHARASGGVYFYTNTALTAGVYLGAGGGAWSSICDRDKKEHLRPVSGSEILTRLSEVPIYRWNYKAQSEEIEHIGPTAQDFYAAFGLGDDDKTISTLDPDGVALAAIQELYRMTKELQERTARLEALEAELTALRTSVEYLMAQKQASPGGPELSSITSNGN
ncbi:MAG: tail fiber domain-containing protein [bacterium]